MIYDLLYVQTSKKFSSILSRPKFRFPPSRAAFILNQFAQLGTIEKHVVSVWFYIFCVLTHSTYCESVA